MKRTVHLGWLHLGYFLHRSPELSFDMSLTRQGATLGVHLVWLGLWACVTSPGQEGTNG